MTDPLSANPSDKFISKSDFTQESMAIPAEPMGCLSDALALLINQKYAEHTLHEILYALRKLLKAHATVILLKDPHSDYLHIKSHCNMSYRFVNTYRRSVGKGIVGRLFYADHFVMTDADGNVDDYQDLRLDFDYTVAAAARIELMGRAAGYLAVYWDRRPDKYVSLENLLRGLAATCSMSLLMQDHGEMIDRLRLMDQDSGLYLFSAFCSRLTEEWKRSRRYHQPLAVALLDLANFKEVINTYGLTTGAALYRDVVSVLKSLMRDHDVMCRFGADEVMFYFPNTDADGARKLLERIETEVLSRIFTPEGIRTALNIGYAVLDSNDEPHDIIWRSQKALHTSRVSNRPIVML